MDKKSYDNGSDFSFVEQKVREVQTTIENAVKTSNYQELNQSSCYSGYVWCESSETC